MTDAVRGKLAASRSVASSAMFTIPNFVTALRIAAAAGMWQFADYHSTVLGLATFAAASDVIDGWLARWLNQVSEIGRRLDQVADLACALAVMYIIVHWEDWQWYNTPIIAITGVYMIIVVGLRSMKLASDTSEIAKWKAIVQFFGVLVIFASHTFEIPAAQWVGYAILWYSLKSTIESLYGYIVEAWNGR